MHILILFYLFFLDSKDGITLNGGRKVLIKKLEIAKVGVAARRISEIISGATSTRDNGNTSEGKRDFDGILCRLEDDAKNIMDSATKGYKNVEAGFVAFNSDYHGPQHHPPKHNL